MVTVTIKTNLQTKLEKIANTTGQSIDEIVDQALTQHLDRLAEQELDAEIRAFEQMHPQLKAHYLDQFIAMYQGKVVDTDADLESLYMRIQSRFGDDQTVLIRQVSDTHDEVYHFHGTRIG